MLLHIDSHIANICKCSCILHTVFHLCSTLILENLNLPCFIRYILGLMVVTCNISNTIWVVFVTRVLKQSQSSTRGCPVVLVEVKRSSTLVWLSESLRISIMFWSICFLWFISSIRFFWASCLSGYPTGAFWIWDINK